MRVYRDPSAEQAVVKVNKEWVRMAKLAVAIREGYGDPLRLEPQRELFTGIFKRLLEDPIEYVKQLTER